MRLLLLLSGPSKICCCQRSASKVRSVSRHVFHTTERTSLNSSDQAHKGGRNRRQSHGATTNSTRAIISDDSREPGLYKGAISVLCFHLSAGMTAHTGWINQGELMTYWADDQKGSDLFSGRESLKRSDHHAYCRPGALLPEPPKQVSPSDNRYHSWKNSLFQQSRHQGWA